MSDSDVKPGQLRVWEDASFDASARGGGTIYLVLHSRDDERYFIVTCGCQPRFASWPIYAIERDRLLENS